MKTTNSIIIMVILMMTGFICYSQLSVKTGSYAYVKGLGSSLNYYLFVKQNTNLSANGNIYLRWGGQLLQGTAYTSTNTGEGVVSVFQRGTAQNSYQYNYWCSPVGGASAAIGNENFGTSMLYSPQSTTNSTVSVTLPWGTLDGIANPLSIASRWIYKFLASDEYSEWLYAGGDSVIAAGQGFTMKGTSGYDDLALIDGFYNKTDDLTDKQRYDFRGKPNDGNITINVTAGQYTLTGNPYPSAIDLKLFLEGATNSTGIAYFWEHDPYNDTHYVAGYIGGYGTYSPVGSGGVYIAASFYTYDGSGNQGGFYSSGSDFARRFSPVGQGFMLQGGTTGTVTMNNSYRVYQKDIIYGGIAEFARMANQDEQPAFLPDIPSVSGFDYTTVSTLPTPQIRLRTDLGEDFINQIVIAFDPEATDGADFAMDAISPADEIPHEVYFPMDGKRYNLSAIDFAMDKKVPLGFRNIDQTTFRIKVEQILNFNGTDTVYLHDKQSDTYHDITNDAYTVTLDPGVQNDRFEITFTNNQLNAPETIKDMLQIVQDNNSKTLTVFNPELINVSGISIYDISGRCVRKIESAGGAARYTLSTASFATGCYIVKATSEDKIQSSKIMISN